MVKIVLPPLIVLTDSQGNWGRRSGAAVARIGFWNHGFSSCFFGVAWRLACQGMVFSGRWPGRRAQWGELPGCWKPWLLAGRRLGVGRAIGQAICAELLGSSGRAKGWEATGIVEYLPRTICQE